MKKKIIIFAAVFALLVTGIAISFADEKDSKFKNLIQKISENDIVVDNLQVKQDNSPIPYILDMDFSSDVDDVCALRVADVLDKKNIISLKAVGLSVKGDKIASAAEGLLDYDKKCNVPVGICTADVYDTSPYWNILETYKTTEHLKRDAVELYKDVLRNNENVVIVTTGYTYNIENLLRDEEGYNLVKDKCKAIYVQGGSYPTGWDSNFSVFDNASSSVRYVSKNCPVKLYFIANDVGNAYTIGEYLQRDYPDDPVSKSIFAYGEEKGRAGWDPTAVWVSVQKNNPNIIAVPVLFTIEDNGVNTFVDDQYSNVYVIRRTNDDLNYFKVTIEELCTKLELVE